MRSLIAAGLLAVCVMASAYSATISQHNAEKNAAEKRAKAQEAVLAENFIASLNIQITPRGIEDLEPRLKPARATYVALNREKNTAYGNTGNSATFDFDDLALAKDIANTRRCMAQAIYYEARSESRVGQLGVADVILNRVKSRVYPNSVCEVVFQGSERRTGCQFSFTCDGSMQARLNKRKWKQSTQLAGAILAGVHKPVSRGATHYHADYVDPYWAPSLTPTATIGTHKFYKFKSRRTVSAAPSTM